jgi:hypothetical protein
VIAVRLSVIAFFKLFSLRDFRWRLPRCLELDKANDSDNWDESELLGLEIHRAWICVCAFLEMENGCSKGFSLTHRYFDWTSIAT